MSGTVASLSGSIATTNSNLATTNTNLNTTNSNLATTNTNLNTTNSNLATATGNIATNTSNIATNTTDITSGNKPINNNIALKRESYKWVIDNIKDKFSIDVLDWYIIDHVLTKEERLDYMINLDWINPPLYAKPLLIDKTNIHILGSQQFYENKKKITLLGDNFDLYTKWVVNKKNEYMSKRKLFFATMKDNVLIFNLDHDSDTLQPADRSKNIGGRGCTNFSESLLNLFAIWLDGIGFPNTIKTKLQRCQYLSLLIRKAILNKKEGIVWYTPEEYEILTEDSNRKDLLLRLKQQI